jgi:two-component system sensor histidine kinase TtrS
MLLLLPHSAQAAAASNSSGLLAAVIILTLLACLFGWRLIRFDTRLSNAQEQWKSCESLVLDALAEGVLGLDPTGRVTFVNHALATMTGWTTEDLLGHDAHEYLHHTHADGEPYPFEQCPIHATLNDGKARFIDDDLFWRRNGSCFPVEYSVTPMQDSRSAMLGTLVVVVRDVTERRGLAERVRRLEMEQAHAARVNMLGELVSGIGHELNQPLTVIGTNARACLRMIASGRTECGECTSVMDKIAVQAERAAEVIRTLRRLSRKETAISRATPVRVADLFETVAVLLHEDARRADVALHRDIQPGFLRVLVQQTQIEQVLINLARNGIEAMTEKGCERRVLLLQARCSQVMRAAEARQNLVEIRVVDTGLGLSRGMSRHLFEPFVTTKPQGIGLGLSISSRIVEAHDSQLQWQTTPGIGTTFYFYLPRDDMRTERMIGNKQ